MASVVASEVGNSSLEACKAQSVASRTFAVFKGVLAGKTITDSSSSDQAYRAVRYDGHLYPNAIQAAEETAGEILTYNGSPIAAVYSACNGGSTVSSQARWGSARPYLIAQTDPWDHSTARTGHGVGMSQRGAKAMASEGYRYRDILSFYYPGTEIAKLEIKGGDSMVKARDFIEKVKIPLREGWGYIYGTCGILWTKERQEAATRDMTVRYGSQWIGHKVVDCSGLVRWALAQLGESIVHHATYQYTDWCKEKGKLIDGLREDGTLPLPGSLVFLKGSQEKIHHVGVFIGDDTCIEAKGTKSGVVTSKLSHWDHWGQCKLIDYSDVSQETASEPVTDLVPDDVVRAVLDKNPQTYVNVRTAPSSGSSKLFQLAKGSVVNILAQDKDWIQIRYGNRIGWAYAPYFTIINPEAEEEPEIEEDQEEEAPPEEFEQRISVRDLLANVLTGLQTLTEQLKDILRKM